MSGLPKKLTREQRLKEVNKPHQEIEGPVADLFANTETGNWRLQRPIILENCKNCGICATNCPCGVITKGETRHVINYTWCKGCGICKEVCPFQAIELRLEAEGGES